MTKTYAQIVKQIEALQKDAEKAKRKETQGIIAQIRETIAAYGLTAEDLGLASAAKGRTKAAEGASPVRKRAVRGKVAKAAKPAPVVKFRDDAGHTWGGIGKRPQWLRDALNAGRTLEEFAVKP